MTAIHQNLADSCSSNCGTTTVQRKLIDSCSDNNGSSTIHPNIIYCARSCINGQIATIYRNLGDTAGGAFDRAVAICNDLGDGRAMVRCSLTTVRDDRNYISTFLNNELGYNFGIRSARHCSKLSTEAFRSRDHTGFVSNKATLILAT